MNKQEKRQVISKMLDISNCRLKETELDTLYDIATHPDTFDGMKETTRNRFTDWCSDGKYTRDEETTYTLHVDDSNISIEEDYRYHDDDGQNGGYNLVHNTGRKLINLYKQIFD